MKVQDLTDALLEYMPDADVDIILNAYIYSAKAHRGQSRRSGEAYISHPLEVANNLVKLKLDATTVAAGLLHDTIEDTLSTPEEIFELFGEEIFQLVDGVTKISQINFSSHEESQAENYRKMIFAMAQDIRVVLIKLADRAHNMQTLGSLSEERQRRIARETTGAPPAAMEKLVDGEQVMNYQKLVERVPVPDHIYDMVVDLVRLSRPGVEGSPDWIKKWVTWGAGPRAVQYLSILFRYRAIMPGRRTPVGESCWAEGAPGVIV